MVQRRSTNIRATPVGKMLAESTAKLLKMDTLNHSVFDVFKFKHSIPSHCSDVNFTCSDPTSPCQNPWGM